MVYAVLQEDKTLFKKDNYNNNNHSFIKIALLTV